MAKDDRGDRPGRDPQPEIGDAELLFREENRRQQGQPSAKPATSGSGSGEVFDLADDPTPAPPAAAAPVRPIPSGAPTKQKPRTPREPRPEAAQADSKLDPANLVEEVWTRTREWGPTLLIVGGWVMPWRSFSISLWDRAHSGPLSSH